MFHFRMCVEPKLEINYGEFFSSKGAIHLGEKVSGTNEVAAAALAT